MITPNPKAVEAAARASWKYEFGDAPWPGPGHRTVDMDLQEAALTLQAAEPHIRSDERRKLLTELAEWCEAKRDEDAAFADEYGRRRETEPSRAGAHKSAREMHLDHANAFREVADHCRELAEKEPGAQEPNANLWAAAQNVVNAWDNPSPGPEKWDRLREKIGYLREALQ